MPLVKVPHPIGTITLDQLRSVAQLVIDKIIAAVIDGASNGACVERPARVDDTRLILSVPRDPAQMLRDFAERGWTDGLPILAPTEAAVRAMIAASGLANDVTLAVFPPSNGNATVEKLAANAVMAGCLPAYFPLVLAAVRAMLRPGYNLDGVQTTTGNVAPLAIVNGPCREDLAINYGANALGQGWRANATIGRAIRLIMANVGGATPGLFDKSTIGQPAKYSFCVGENESANPWQSLHVERGLAHDTDAVSMFGCSGVYSAVDMASQTTTGLLKTFALTMTGGLASGVTGTEVMFIICPEHAAIFARDGLIKNKLRAKLFAIARVPFDKISDENLELLENRRPQWFQTGLAREIGAVDRPEDIWLVVAGGAGAKSAYIPGRTGTRLQTVAVEYGDWSNGILE